MNKPIIEELSVDEPSLERAPIPSAEAEEVARIVRQTAELLPAQGPITAFVFLNTLQALEDLPFDEGLRKGAALFGCHPYLTEDRYRQKLDAGRIRVEDLVAVLREDLGARADEPIENLGTRLELRRAMLEYPLRDAPPEELRWFVAETDALTSFRGDAQHGIREQMLEETRHWIMRDVRNGGTSGDGRPKGPRTLLADLIERYGEGVIERWSPKVWESLALQALWRVCRDGVHGAQFIPASRPPLIRHRDLLLEAVGEDTDELVHPLLIRYCAAFADQGFAARPLPHRDQGFLGAFCELYGQKGGPPDVWMNGLDEELRRIRSSGMSGAEVVAESLRLLGVGPGEQEDFLVATLLALRGWAGALWQNEVRGDRVPIPAPPGTLVEFLAVRLILERFAIRHVAERSWAYHGPTSDLRETALARIKRHSPTSLEQRAFLVFQIAQILGWQPEQLHAMSRSAWSRLVVELESFSGMERRRVFHAAFERRYRKQALDAFSIHAKRPAKRVAAPRFQASFCIDTREEALCRHIEEISPDFETFQTAGFYSIPIYYRGVADAHFAALCPIVVRPRHWVVEEVVLPLEAEHRRRANARRAIGAATHEVHRGTRSAAKGALLTAGVGLFASIPLLARVLFPGLTASFRRNVGRFVQPPQITRLVLERTAETPSPEPDGIGFTVPEMADFAERVLRDIGLTSNFARLVMFFGHGSFCLNNPHKSCYDCGACSGSAGSPNARTLAAMLNDARVREILAGRGLAIPGTTFFLGGLHNTTDDSITFLDLDLLPKSHVKDLEEARRILGEACERNAHERCRRFHSAPLGLSTAAAHRHVRERSEDLAQVRPEFGNASNAICFVGRRCRIKGLFMDRRAFNQSYDAAQDDAEATILGRILGAVIVVCEGINLQYYFSYVDSPGWGSGTKLPHNVTSLLGVMDGHASDLRTGLPWQGVEIHEPMRLLFVIECKPEAIRKIMARNPQVARIVRNGWVQLALLDYNSNEISVYRDDEFRRYDTTTTELPKAASSIDWYRGWRDHLGFAEIER